MRKFESLNHPEPEGDGTFLYSVLEATETPRGGKAYMRVADGLTENEVEIYINQHGERS